MEKNENKKSIPGWVLLILCIGSLATSIVAISKSARTVRIGYVKTGELMNNYQGFKDAQEMLQGKHRQWKANTDTLEAQFASALGEYNNRLSSLSKEEQQKQERLLAMQEQQKNNYMEGVRQRAQQEQQVAIDSVITKVNSFVKEFAKSNGYDFIFGTTNDGSLLYGNEADDLTALLTEEINKVYKKGSIFDTVKVR